jgi:hypothetical protein
MSLTAYTQYVDVGAGRNSHSTAEVDSCIDQGGLKWHHAADISTKARDCFIAVAGRWKNSSYKRSGAMLSYG